eukprot:EC720937.1.p1 GENE.EC720937.1~~EC720937.1.p1  ORF type:complete len:90 (+),score=9.10 EC720937.1:239-508(+)
MPMLLGPFPKWGHSTPADAVLTKPLTLRSGDAVLLCTDGITDNLTEDTIERLLRTELSTPGNGNASSSSAAPVVDLRDGRATNAVQALV